MNRKRMIYSSIITLIIVELISLLGLLLKENENLLKENIRNGLVWVVISVAVLTIVLIIGKTIGNRFGRSAGGTLNKIIKYNQKRKEIEQEIECLTQELLMSDAAQFVDINRLVISGQPHVVKEESVLDYDNFLKQFGIPKDTIKIKENSAIFLSPFNEQGNQLFKACQSILAEVGIFLQRTDNLVDKDDILMNIISLLVQSELVIVNIDGRNPNVYYELGIAHAIGKKTILLSKTKFSYTDIGFDIRQKRIIMYENTEDLERQLLSEISRIKINDLKSLK